MIPSPCVRRSASVLLGSVCVGTVALFGELSVEAPFAVSATGVIVLSAALTRRSGEAAEPVGRRGLPWTVWLAVGAWLLARPARHDA